MKAKIDTEKYNKFNNAGEFKKDQYYLAFDEKTYINYEGNPPQNAGEATYYTVIDEKGCEIIVGKGVIIELKNE